MSYPGCLIIGNYIISNIVLLKTCQKILKNKKIHENTREVEDKLTIRVYKID